MTSFSVKVFTLIIRTLAKPIVAWVTHYKKVALAKNDSKFNQMMKVTLTKIGQDVHYYNTKINNKLFKLSKETDVKPLSESLALEKGAEVFSEFLVYAILITLPTLEIIRQIKAGQLKEKKKEDLLDKMKEKIESLKNENKELKDQLKGILDTLNGISGKLNDL